MKLPRNILAAMVLGASIGRRKGCDFPTLGKIGFTYDVELIRGGRVIDSERVENLMPLEGLNLLLSCMFKGTAVPANWYVGLYSGNYTPISTDTAAAFPGTATELTSYAEATRQAFTSGAVAGGALTNTASKAAFTFTGNTTVYGGFMSSAGAKGATTGYLLSAVKFASPKTGTSGDVLTVTAGLTLTSA